MDLRILSSGDIRRLLPMPAGVDLMERAMIAVSAGRARIPLRSTLPVSAGNLMGLMPGYLADPECFGVKALSLFPRNPAAGLSSHLGLVVLFEPEHGQPVAILDAAELTAIRTAAVSGLATRLLARPDAADLAILGAGEQARSHLAAMVAVRNVRRVRVWSRSTDHAVAFADEMSAHVGMAIEVARDVRTAVAGADIVCTVTASSQPILHGDWIGPGAHLNIVGSSRATAVEIDTPLVAKARFFVDFRESATNEAGEYLRALEAGAITANHILGEIGAVASGHVAGRVSPADITIFKSLGIAAEDLAAAHFVLQAAIEQDVGQVARL